MSGKKNIAIGVEDYKRIIVDNTYYVDKTNFLKDWLNSNEQVLLIPRPRRFGKTLTLSMFKYFLDITKTSCDLFKNMKIGNETELIDKHMNQYPVISLTLKDLDSQNFEEFERNIKGKLLRLLGDYEYCLSKIKSKVLKQQYEELTRDIKKELPLNEYNNILALLSQMLYEYYGKEVVILIDEYDRVVERAFVDGYYEQVMNFMRPFLSSALKSNEYLYRAVLTGITKITGESIFSGMNNIEVSTILDKKYNSAIGFTQNEVNEIVNYYEMNDKSEEFKEWYNGYNFGGEAIYNPWSVLNAVDKSMFKPYWINTSTNALIQEMFNKARENTKTEIHGLLEDKVVVKEIDTDVVYDNYIYEEDKIWSFLLMTGYLKIGQHIDNDYYELLIPNNEVKTVYQKVLVNYFTNMDKKSYDLIIEGMVEKNIRFIQQPYNDFLQNIGQSDKQEMFYHATLYTIANSFAGWIVKSNLAAGEGYADIVLIPKQTNKNCDVGILIECKSIKASKLKYYSSEEIEHIVEDKINEGVAQIKSRKYEDVFQDYEYVTSVNKYVIVFYGKECRVEIVD